MKFELDDYHRNITDRELVEDIKRVSASLNKTSITTSEYDRYGRYNHTTYYRRFSNWKNALEMAGLSTTSKNYYIHDSDYIFDLRRVASILNKSTVVMSEYKQIGKYSPGKLLMRFGNWDSALKAASLETTGYHRKVTELDLFQDIENTWIRLGRQPKTSDIKSGISKYSMTTYIRHFGSWRNALEAFVKYINSADDTINDTLSNNTEKSNCENTDTNNCRVFHRTKRSISLQMRFAVLKRDNFKCCFCGASPATNQSVTLHIDHIVPWSKGGETVIENLQTLCSKCNLEKSNMMPD